jgi:quercetin dioxygenase-like cupin family protein
MMVCECTFAPGVKVPNHSHPHEQAGYVVSGKIQITIDDKSFDLGAGDSYCAPSNVPHSAFALEHSVVLDIFSPPREDYRSPPKELQTNRDGFKADDEILSKPA